MSPSDSRAPEASKRETLRPAAPALSLVTVTEGTTRHPLGIGEFVIGRSRECEVPIENALVSRKHARLVVTEEAIWLEDLSSANGTFVDGEPIRGKCRITARASVSLGGAMISIDPTAGTSGEHKRPEPREPAVRASIPPTPSREDDDEENEGPSTRRMTRDDIMAELAAKAMSQGRIDEGERYLSPILADRLAKIGSGVGFTPAMLEWSSRHALTLAAATRAGKWFDYVVETYCVANALMPATIVDELYALVRSVRRVDVAMLRRYVAMAKDIADKGGPAERFIARRLEGLASVAMAG